MFSNVINTNIKKKTQAFLRVHPVVGLITVFVGLPTFILGSVALLTTAVSLPVAFLFGWI